MRLGRLKIVAVCVLGFATAQPAAAAMKQDLADCPVPKRATAAAACTRILESGRLPRGEHYIAYYNRSWAHRLAGKSELALADLDRAASLNPRFAKTYLSRGILRRDRRDFDLAKADFDRFVKLQPSSWEGYFHRARTDRDLGRSSDALADVALASKRAPQRHEIKVLEALLVAEDGDSVRALRLVDLALEGAPLDAMAHYVRAVAHRQGGNSLAALRAATRALEIEPGFTSALSLRGQLHEARGRKDLAREDYEQVLRMPLKHIDAALASSIARGRLAALQKGAGMASARTSTAPLRATATASIERTCRRYIPAAATTITVDCN